MAVLVTRPAPDNEATAEALRIRGFEVVLAPMLAFQPLPFVDDGEADYAGVILTSANAVRAILAQPLLVRIVDLPAFAVGTRTAVAARDAGFTKVETAGGDAGSLLQLVAARKKRGKRAPLLYLSGADVSRDLASELLTRGIEVVSLAVYRMAPLDEFTDASRQAFAANAIEAVLHYSQRSAAAFVSAARRAGLEVTALALPQLCLSAQIATVLHEAGAMQVSVAGVPNEVALLDVLEQTVRPSRRSS